MRFCKRFHASRFSSFSSSMISNTTHGPITSESYQASASVRLPQYWPPNQHFVIHPMFSRRFLWRTPSSSHGFEILLKDHVLWPHIFFNWWISIIFIGVILLSILYWFSSNSDLFDIRSSHFGQRSHLFAAPNPADIYRSAVAYNAGYAIGFIMKKLDFLATSLSLFLTSRSHASVPGACTYNWKLVH